MTIPSTTQPPRRWTRGRWALLGLALFCALGLVGVAAEMASRLNDYHDEFGRELYVFQPVIDREFTWAGIPVEITDDMDPDGADVAVLRFGDATERLRSGLSSLPESVPGLRRHEAWLRVLRFVPRRGESIGELQQAISTGATDERLAIVVRQQRPGVDPESFGEVMRGDWRFRLLELMPDGAIEEETLRFPESERSFNRRVQRARRAGDPVPERRGDELKFGTWQFDAALNVMPKSGAPAPQFGRGAMDALGWTLLAATVLALVGLFSLAWAFAPARPVADDAALDDANKNAASFDAAS
ncbi:MAG: hypothetical protein AAFX79_13145 [Planctomycetota bacterium]